jgi:quinone-modifying oxidoreductase subunit QmoC
MAEAVVVRPDRKFVEEIIAAGGGDLKHCMQCANCSTVCELSDGRPFPRKEMIWAQWGLKDRLMADPDVWMCHQCNDCSRRCPRGARPGDMLAAVRRLTVAHYAVPRFMASLANRAAYLPLAFLVPIVLLAVALLARDPIAQALGLETEPAFYASFFPHWLIIGLYGFFTGLAFLAAVVGVVRFWSAMRRSDEELGLYATPKGISASVRGALKDILSHYRFGFCTAQKPRRLAHLAVFYGFLALFVVTSWAVLDLYVNPMLGIASRYPFDLLHPMKILANVGGVALVYGAVKVISDRKRIQGPAAAASTSFDWIFVWLILGVGVTGFAVEVFRFTVGPEPAATARTAAYATYFVHLVLVFQLLTYLPFSKFAHVLYRTVAMVYAEHTGRHRPVHRPGVPQIAAAPTELRLRGVTAETH